jgi:hypothetical protein
LTIRVAPRIAEIEEPARQRLDAGVGERLADGYKSSTPERRYATERNEARSMARSMIVSYLRYLRDHHGE